MQEGIIPHFILQMWIHTQQIREQTQIQLVFTFTRRSYISFANSSSLSNAQTTILSYINYADESPDVCCPQQKPKAAQH